MSRNSQYFHIVGCIRFRITPACRVPRGRGCAIEWPENHSLSHSFSCGEVRYQTVQPEAKYGKFMAPSGRWRPDPFARHCTSLTALTPRTRAHARRRPGYVRPRAPGGGIVKCLCNRNAAKNRGRRLSSNALTGCTGATTPSYLAAKAAPPSPLSADFPKMNGLEQCG